MFASISLFIIGLALGYGLREVLSRRRRAAARRDYYERHPEKITADGDVKAGNLNGQ
jgi:hypothetical protein